MQLIVKSFGVLDNVNITLSPGLTALSGPNGCGKSTTVSAIFFAITGELIDGRNVQDCINWTNMTDRASVKLITDEFTIERVIRKTGVSHSLTLADGTLITRKTDVNDWLFNYYKILGPSQLKEVFFAQQLLATEIFKVTPSARLGMLSKVFGFDKLEDCREAIYKVLAETPIPAPNEDVLNTLRNSYAEESAKIPALEDSINILQTEISGLHFDEAVYTKIINAPLDTVVENASKQHASTVDKINSLRPRYEELLRLCAVLEALRTYNEQRELFENWKHDVAELEAELKALDDGGPSSEQLREIMGKISARMVEVNTEIATLRSRESLKDGLCPLTNESACLALLQSSDPQIISAKIEGLSEELSGLNNDHDTVSALLSDSQTKEAKRKLFTDALKKLLDNPVQEPIKALTKEDEEALLEVPSPEDLFKEFDSVRADLGALEKTKEMLEATLAQADKETVTEKEKQEQHELRAKFQELSGILQAKTQEMSTFKTAVATLKTNIELMEEQEKSSKAMAFRADVLRSTRELLSRSNLQRVLLKKTIVRLNREISKGIEIFGFPYVFFVSEDGEILFNSETRENIDVRFLSGGQLYVAAVIVRLAFAKALCSTFPIVALDEPSTCLDDTSRTMLSELLGVINQQAVSDGLFVVVPTHDTLITAVANQNINIGDCNG